MTAVSSGLPLIKICNKLSVLVSYCSWTVERGEHSSDCARCPYYSFLCFVFIIFLFCILFFSKWLKQRTWTDEFYWSLHQLYAWIYSISRLFQRIDGTTLIYSNIHWSLKSLNTDFGSLQCSTYTKYLWQLHSIASILGTPTVAKTNANSRSLRRCWRCWGVPVI